MVDLPEARTSSIPWDGEDTDPTVAVAIDIGGSLAKVAYLDTGSRRHRRTDSAADTLEDAAAQRRPAAAGGLLQPRLQLCFFETSHIKDCFTFIKRDVLRDQLPSKIFATGGGAHKYNALFQEICGVPMTKLGELDCLARGCTFLLQHLADEAFVFQAGGTPERQFVPQPAYPFMLVNVGSGCSVLLVKGPGESSRVDGSAVGGGTFWGLANMMMGQRDFDTILELATQGNTMGVDMLVGDIYGQSTPASLGLDPSLPAAFFGRAARAASDPLSTSRDSTGASDSRPSDADIAAGLLQMITYNAAQIGCLNARLYGVKQIVFSGFFFRGQHAAMKLATEAVNYWGRKEMTALFLRHEGYLGCIGAFLHSRPDLFNTPMQLTRPAAVSEYFVNTKETVPEPKPARSSVNFRPFSLEVRPEPLVRLNQLQSDYAPDTIDLMSDTVARDYWLTCFENNIEREYQRARNDSKTDRRPLAFKQTFLQHMSVLRQDPTAYGQLSVRSILELRQQCLREFHFVDPYREVKRSENEAALQLLPERLARADALELAARARDVIEGVLAGNSFDWGASATAERMEQADLDFENEKRKLRNRPWLVDDLAAVVSRLTTRCSDGAPAYKLALIFVDNAGADIVLGVIPFARFLLQAGTRVVLAANTWPVLNDVTADELRHVLQQAAKLDSVLAAADADGRLLVMENGNGSPCLDLTRIDWRLAETCAEADLVVLEGMGRAIHTNYNARLASDTLKLAMIKNSWLAERLGGQLYDVVCKFEAASFVV